MINTGHFCFVYRPIVCLGLFLASWLFFREEIRWVGDIDSFSTDVVP